MRTLLEVSTEKLRGGFYTPPPLVQVCLDRIADLAPAPRRLTVLEPSAGDGAFIRGLERHTLCDRIESLLALEVDPTAAAACRTEALDAPFDANVMLASALRWGSSTADLFDVVVGNPPFVRYQFIPSADLTSIELLGDRLGVPFNGVSNLWIPVLLGALDRLRPDGVMAVVVPAELFTGVSAGAARRWLLAHFDNLRVDLFEPGSFPSVLQEVIVISGQRAPARIDSQHTTLRFVEHQASSPPSCWDCPVQVSTENWTRLLLNPRQLAALATATRLPDIRSLRSYARLEVSIVTGANDYFSVASAELAEFKLTRWARPLLPRMRHARGVVFTHHDYEAAIEAGAKTWLLDFDESKPDPNRYVGAARYLAQGEAQNLHRRYKTSIRAPWYRVPSIWSGSLMLSKRSHAYPKLVLNEAGVVTTDTIYRGAMLPDYKGRDHDLVAAFHNSLTLLTAELEGRSFGGGVLELVPSEIGRLSVPLPTGLGASVCRLDQIARHCGSSTSDQNTLVDETDQLMVVHVHGMTADLLDLLREARLALQARRLSRN